MAVAATGGGVILAFGCWLIKQQLALSAMGDGSGWYRISHVVSIDTSDGSLSTENLYMMYLIHLRYRISHF
jgi:hypothetical protein